jgi:hypothetical protein
MGSNDFLRVVGWKNACTGRVLVPLARRLSIITPGLSSAKCPFPGLAHPAPPLLAVFFVRKELSRHPIYPPPKSVLGAIHDLPADVLRSKFRRGCAGGRNATTSSWLQILRGCYHPFSYLEILQPVLLSAHSNPLLVHPSTIPSILGKIHKYCTMGDQYEAVPPPYTSEDPLSPSATTGSEVFCQSQTSHLNADYRDVPSYELAVGEDEAVTFFSAAQYFDEHPPPHPQLGDGLVQHTISMGPQSDARGVSFVPLCWQIALAHVTHTDVMTFANYLFALQNTSETFLPEKSGGLVAGITEPWLQRQRRFESVVAEWNDGFFAPRGLQVHLDLETNNAAYYEPQDMACTQCAIASKLILDETSAEDVSAQMNTSMSAICGSGSPAWRLEFDARGPSALAADLAAQAVSRRLQQRAGHIGGCGKRSQQQRCASRRRHCGRDAFKSSFPAPNPVGGGKAFGSPLLSPPFFSTANSSAEPTDHLDLIRFSDLMADMRLSTCGRSTSAVQHNSLAPGTSLPGIKTDNAPRIAFPARPSPLSKPQRLALKSELKALKHEVKAAVRQVKAERKEEARASSECSGRGMSVLEKRELKKWRKENIGDIRDAKKSVMKAGRVRN